MKRSMLNKWDYSGVNQMMYSDDKQESYKKAAQFLGDSVEDWGCGTGYASIFFKNYRGIDCSPSKNHPEAIDLRQYTSDVENILIRQVLECTEDWKLVLENAIKSFRRRLCLIIMTPFSDKEKVLERESVLRADGSVVEGRFIDAISFKKQDILDYFPKDRFKVREETIKTNQGYGHDWILYVEKIS
jgi:hypothetical protein